MAHVVLHFQNEDSDNLRNFPHHVTKCKRTPNPAVSRIPLILPSNT